MDTKSVVWANHPIENFTICIKSMFNVENITIFLRKFVECNTFKNINSNIESKNKLFTNDDKNIPATSNITENKIRFSLGNILRNTGDLAIVTFLILAYLDFTSLL